MTRILPLRSGWDPTPGDELYPQDLPPEWRLTYFANTFLGVLVPGPLWRGIGAFEAASWAADTPPRFRFFLDLGDQDFAGAPVPICRALGDRFGGLVGESLALDTAAGDAPSVLRRLAWDHALAGASRAEGFAWEAPASVVQDLRGARHWLAARLRPPGLGEAVGSPLDLGGPPQVVLLGGCRFEDLERWQTLLELMGLA